MAGGQPVLLKGYRFIARPQSRCRRLVKDFWPYWQASKPRFILTITREGSPAQQQPVNWFVRFATGDFVGGQVSIPPLQTKERVTISVGGKLLGFTGDTLLVLPVDLISSKPLRYETLYTFHTTPRAWVFLAIVAGLLAGLFAALFKWLFSLCN